MKNFGTKPKTSIQKNYKYLFFVLSFFIINLTFFLTICSQNNLIFFSKRTIAILVVMTIITIGFCSFILWAKNKGWTIEKIFLIVGPLLGLIYLLTVPIGRVPDEPAHINRIYSISQGGITTENQGEINGNYLPENIANISNDFKEQGYSKTIARISEPISENQIFQKTINTNPIEYIPQIIGLKIGRFLHLPMIITLYLTRLFNLTICIAIIYLCLKYIPILKKPLFLLSCLPMTMHLFAGITYDGIIFCSAITILTFILYSIYNHKYNFQILHFFVLALACIIFTAAKPVYFPICLLLFFMPNSCFKNKKQKIFYISSILIITFCSFLLWSSMSVVLETQNGANSSEQIHYILTNPINYTAILADNAINMPSSYLTKLSQLEWLDIATSGFYIYSALIIFVILCAEERLNPSKVSSHSFRSVTLLLTTITVALIFTALYIQHTPPGNSLIMGVQTRYLLPIAVLLPMICIPLASTAEKKANTHKNLLPNIYLYAFVLFLNIDAITIVLCTHI